MKVIFLISGSGFFTPFDADHSEKPHAGWLDGTNCWRRQSHSTRQRSIA